MRKGGICEPLSLSKAYQAPSRSIFMQHSLSLSNDAATFGFAAGVCFWGYFLFEVPSNLLLEKLEARVWIARTS